MKGIEEYEQSKEQYLDLDGNGNGHGSGNGYKFVSISGGSEPTLADPLKVHEVFYTNTDFSVNQLKTRESKNMHIGQILFQRIKVKENDRYYENHKEEIEAQRRKRKELEKEKLNQAKLNEKEEKEKEKESPKMNKELELKAETGAVLEN